MKFIEFKEKLKKLSIFSLSDINVINPEFHRNQLTEWLSKGYIKKIKKGYYFFSDVTIDDAFLYMTSNKIYAPSYVSMEIVLANHEFIPESVYGITAITTRKTKIITTDLGVFMYRNIKKNLFFGYNLEKRIDGVYKIASKEKAMLDFLYFNPNLESDLAIQEMRFNIQEIQSKMDWDLCKTYLKIFDSVKLNKRFKKFEGYIKDA